MIILVSFYSHILSPNFHLFELCSLYSSQIALLFFEIANLDYYGELCNIVLYCTILYIIVQYCTILYNIVHYCTILYYIVQHCTTLYNIDKYNIDEYNIDE